MKKPETLAKKRFIETRRRARKEGTEFSLTSDWFIKNFSLGVCALTGLPFSFNGARRGHKYDPYSPSVDRIDNSRGYHPDNCRVVLTAVNVALNHWGYDVFLPIARALAARA